MRIARYLAGVGLLCLSLPGFAGEFGNECAWGLANDKHVKTECKVNAVREDGKTYCFSSDKAMDAFMKDVPMNMKKAKEVFGRA